MYSEKKRILEYIYFCHAKIKNKQKLSFFAALIVKKMCFIIELLQRSTSKKTHCEVLNVKQANRKKT